MGGVYGKVMVIIVDVLYNIFVLIIFLSHMK